MAAVPVRWAKEAFTELDETAKTLVVQWRKKRARAITDYAQSIGPSGCFTVRYSMI